MCVLALAWKPNPRWHLVVAANRDELHCRAAVPLARWDHPRQVLAGRDLLSGGTWMGVSEEGRFAAVTNVRGYGALASDRESRGQLVLDLLTGASREIDEQFAADFNPFNVIVVARGTAAFAASQPSFQVRTLDPDVYGLSNGELDESWPKTMRVRSGLREWLEGGTDRPAELLERLAEGSSAVPDDSVREPHLSPVFMRDRRYGTRCSTIVAVDAKGQGTIVERRYSADAQVTGETTLRFTWPLLNGGFPGGATGLPW
jgi:uncharacterized protein with NRDE domain